MHIIVVSEGEETEKGPEKIGEEIIVGNFFNLEKLKSAKYSKFRVPPRINPRENTPRDIVIKMRKIKERILKAAREKQQITYKGTPIKFCLVAKLCPTFCNPMDCSLPGSSVHGISQQEYWSGLPFSFPGDLPDPGIKLMSPALAGGFFHH